MSTLKPAGESVQDMIKRIKSDPDRAASFDKDGQALESVLKTNGTFTEDVRDESGVNWNGYTEDGLLIEGDDLDE